MTVNEPTLRERRKACRLSQEALARKADCSMSMVRLLESGYRPETSDVLDRITRVLSERRL